MARQGRRWPTQALPLTGRVSTVAGKTRYALTGNWSSTGTWSTSSGGASGASVPTTSTDVVLDANSGTVTINVASNRVCRSLNCTGYTGTLQCNQALLIGDGTAGTGNVALKMVAGMTLAGSVADFRFVSTSATQQSIDFGGKTPYSVTISGAGSSYKLLSDVTLVALSTKTPTWKYTASGGSFDANGRTITVTMRDSVDSHFYGGGSTYFKVSLLASGAQNLYWHDSCTVNTLSLDGGTAPNLVFNAGTTTTIGTLSYDAAIINGILTSSTTGTFAWVKSGGGTASLDYFTISHCVATPSNTWYAGTHSTDNQATATAGSGWIFTAPPSTAVNSLFFGAGF